MQRGAAARRGGAAPAFQHHTRHAAERGRHERVGVSAPPRGGRHSLQPPPGRILLQPAVHHRQAPPRVRCCPGVHLAQRRLDLGLRSSPIDAGAVLNQGGELYACQVESGRWETGGDVSGRRGKHRPD